jgi:hypothetical protein
MQNSGNIRDRRSFPRLLRLSTGAEGRGCALGLLYFSAVQRSMTEEFRYLQDCPWALMQPEHMESPANPSPSATPAATSFDLSQVYVHLGLGAQAETLPDFTWSEEYLRRYEADHEADGDEGRLVMIGPEETTWTSWVRGALCSTIRQRQLVAVPHWPPRRGAWDFTVRPDLSRHQVDNPAPWH